MAWPESQEQVVVTTRSSVPETFERIMQTLLNFDIYPFLHGHEKVCRVLPIDADHSLHLLGSICQVIEVRKRELGWGGIFTFSSAHILPHFTQIEDIGLKYRTKKQSHL